MARILVGSFPAAEQVSPLAALVRSLTNRGHRVVWSCTPEFRDRIQAAGAQFVTSRQTGSPAGTWRSDLKRRFIDRAPQQLQDLHEIAARFGPDLLLSDPDHVGAQFLHELSGIPLAILSAQPLRFSSVSAAPFGLGWAPDASSLGQMRNRILHWTFEHVIFRGLQREWNATRARVGLPPAGWIMDGSKSASLFLQASVPGFEYPRQDLPPHVQFVGLIPELPAESVARAPVVVTDGGYQATQQALAQGAPVVVAGSGAEASEVAARVTWSGTGINLGTDSPAAGRIRAAVNEILGDPKYRERAARLQAEYASYSGVASAVARIEGLASAVQEGTSVEFARAS